MSAVDATAEEREPVSPLGRAAAYLGRAWLFLFLVGLIAYFSLTTPNHAFFGVDNFRTIALDTSEVILLAVGMTFIIVTAGIDLSIGGTLVLAGVSGGLVMLKLAGTDEQVTNLQYPHAARAIPAGVAVILVVGALCGFVNGALITRLRMPPFIVTLGTFGIFLGGAKLMTGGTNLKSVPLSFQDSVGNGKIAGIYVPVLIALVAVVLALVLFNFTRFGRYTRAIGSNAEGSRRTGINVDLHLIKVYTLAGFLAGVAAVIDLARFGSMNLAAHQNDNLNAIGAVVIGGTSLFGGVGTVLGSLVGAFIPTVLQNGFVISGINPFWQEVLVGATIIFAVYLDQLRRRRNER